MYLPGAPQTLSEIEMTKLMARSLIGHNGLGTGVGWVHPQYTAFAHPPALC